MGEGTLELPAAEILAFPLPWGEGQGEGRVLRALRTSFPNGDPLADPVEFA